MANQARPKAQRMNLADLLLRHGAIDADQLAQAEEEQTKWGGDLGRILVDLGFINEELLVRAQAQQLGIPALNPAAHPLLPELVRALPVQICERFGVIGVQVDEATRRLRVATSDPGNAAHLTQIGELRAGGKVKITYEQDRLPACRRTERGNPVWTITGFAQVDHEAAHTFDTARPEGGDRVEVEALVDLPHAGIANAAIKM